MRRRALLNNTTIASEGPELCDVILYDKVNEKLIFTSDFTSLSPTSYEPVGVVVIPTSHDVYGTGECGVMALMSASLDTPDTGQTSNASITWGTYGTNYPELTNFDKVVRMGTTNNNISDNIDGLSSYGYLPLMQSGMSSKFECPHDTKAKYYNLTSSSYGYIPSPYLNDGSRNPDYYTTDSPSSIYNAMSDFAGKSNTEFLCSKATSQPDWKTDGTISNSYNAGYHAAACCCWRFHTPGTNQGDWYLPACGELGYVTPRYDMINDTISALQTHFGKTLCPLDTNSYWSSSEYGASLARSVYFNNGSVGTSSRHNSYYVRPFMRIKFEEQAPI